MRRTRPPLLCPPPGLLVRPGDRSDLGRRLPRLLLRSRRVSPEAGGVPLLQGHRDRGDGQHDGIVPVHRDPERHEGQAGQQTRQQLRRQTRNPKGSGASQRFVVDSKRGLCVSKGSECDPVVRH